MTNASYPEKRKDVLASMAQTVYKRPPMSANEGTNERARELRGKFIISIIAAHFSFGNEKGMGGIPESKAAFTHKEILMSAADPNKVKDVRGSHINYLFNPKQAGNRVGFTKTTYQEKISEQANDPGRFDGRYMHPDLHKANFVVGFDGPTVQSEAASKYFRHIIYILRFVKSELKETGSDIINKVQQMKQPHFAYEHISCPVESKDRFLSESKKKFVAPPSSNGSEIKQEVKSSAAHFSLGTQGNSFVSTKQLYHAPPTGKYEHAGLTANQVHDLRSEHFSLGKDKDTWTTQYGNQHGWIQPIGEA